MVIQQNNFNNMKKTFTGIDLDWHPKFGTLIYEVEGSFTLPKLEEKVKINEEYWTIKGIELNIVTENTTRITLKIKQ